MIKFGLEKEMFLLDPEEKPMVIPKGLPFDECGLLLEARGTPYPSIYDAVYSLLAEAKRIEDAVRGDFPLLHVSDAPVLKVDRKTKIAAERLYAKGVLSYRNLYGHEHHRNSPDEITAGIHISVTSEHQFAYHDMNTVPSGQKVIFTYNQNFDWVTIFLALDRAFKDEIKESKRLPGFYEVKGNGRVEYRSLPSNADPSKIIDVITALKLA